MLEVVMVEGGMEVEVGGVVVVVPMAEGEMSAPGLVPTSHRVLTAQQQPATASVDWPRLAWAWPAAALLPTTGPAAMVRTPTIRPLATEATVLALGTSRWLCRRTMAATALAVVAQGQGGTSISLWAKLYLLYMNNSFSFL